MLLTSSPSRADSSSRHLPASSASSSSSSFTSDGERESAMPAHLKPAVSSLPPTASSSSAASTSTSAASALAADSSSSSKAAGSSCCASATSTPAPVASSSAPSAPGALALPSRGLQPSRVSSVLDRAAVSSLLRAEGFSEIFEWQDGPCTHYSEHSHPTLNCHYLLRGHLSVYYPAYRQRIQYTAGDRFDIPADLAHVTDIGDSGAVYVVASKRGS